MDACSLRIKLAFVVNPVKLTLRCGFHVKSRCLKVVGMPDKFLSSVELNNFGPRISQTHTELPADTQHTDVTHHHIYLIWQSSLTTISQIKQFHQYMFLSFYLSISEILLHTWNKS